MSTRFRRIVLFIYVIYVVVLFICIPSSRSLPFIVLHGIGDSCKNNGVSHFIEILGNWSNSHGYCLEIGDGQRSSWLMPFQEQTAIACDKVKEMIELQNGYNIVGLSQGNLIARGIIEFCDGGPKVKNLISLAGPHAGIASIPFCEHLSVCIILDELIKTGIYTSFIQEHFAPSGYVKIPTDIDAYLEGCRFLPLLNNEIEGNRNTTYKERFSSLENLILIMFEQDTVLVPKETSWFGYYLDGSFDIILSPQQTDLYRGDWIGLRELDEGRKVKFVKVKGRHLEISRGDMKEYIVPYLKEDEDHLQKKMLLHGLLSVA